MDIKIQLYFSKIHMRKKHVRLSPSKTENGIQPLLAILFWHTCKDDGENIHKAKFYVTWTTSF